MLIDDLLANPNIPYAEVEFPGILAELRAAHVFALSTSVLNASDHLMMSCKTPETVASLFRCPYPVIWLEGIRADAKEGVYILKTTSTKSGA